METTLREKVKLEEPVHYWLEKFKSHDAALFDLRRWVLVSGFIGLLVMLGVATSAFRDSYAGSGVPWRPIAYLFIVASLVIWALRVLVRLMLSAEHLKQDAAERVVMAKTYMALVLGDKDSRGSLLKDDDRALVLAPLFRPAATGIVSDDGGPPHVSDIVSKIVSR